MNEPDGPRADLGLSAPAPLPVVGEGGGLFRLLAALAAPRTPEVLVQAQARLWNAQAAVLELEVARGRPTVRVESFDEVLPGRADVVVCGKRRAGKSRWMARVERKLREIGHPTVTLRGTWPDEKTRDACVLLQEAGDLLEPSINRESDSSRALRSMIARARERGLSFVFEVQNWGQVPPWLLRHDVWLLYLGSSWTARRTAREELSDRMDAAHEALRGAPSGCGVLVDPEGECQVVSLHYGPGDE